MQVQRGPSWQIGIVMVCQYFRCTIISTIPVQILAIRRTGTLATGSIEARGISTGSLAVRGAYQVEVF
jgi:hypothetical protein